MSTYDDLVGEIATRISRSSRTVACAESLTAGAIASTLARGEGAANWLAGGVVAYRSDVKFSVLGVSEGPVMTSRCAEEMADGVASLMRTDLAVSCTGVGGPDGEEGEPPGSVFIATRADDHTVVSHHHFDGGPPQVLEQTVHAALRHLLERLPST